MRLVERAAVVALHRLDPERAHDLAILALASGLVPGPGPVTLPRLATRIFGLDLANPVGLAAGFDKNVRAAAALMRQGFGFIEVGAVTPRPQSGNARPRLFRLSEDRAIINRFGFNNEGMEAVALRLAGLARRVPVGVNLGANKDSTDRVADFARVLTACGRHADFATVNVSSPNTEKLRDLQGRSALAALLRSVMAARDDMERKIPLLLKISPDLGPSELADVAGVAIEAGLDGIIATNTTLAREGLVSRHAPEAGGLSGAPLFERSTRILAQLSQLTNGKIPLIGVGGIASAEDAYAKIRAGASAVQLYSALIYQGMSLAPRIARDLDRLLARDGFATVTEAVGTGRGDWL